MRDAPSAVEGARSRSAPGRGRGGVAGADESDPRGSDAERAGEEGPEREHHHEVEDVDELYRADEEDEGAFTGLAGHQDFLTSSRSPPGSVAPHGGSK